MAESSSRPFRVLLVCTGNICRSAMAERLGRAFLSEKLGAEARFVKLESAGMQSVVGSAMHPDSALVLNGLGGDAEGFLARQFDEALAADADLILTMTRKHRRAVLERAPKALARTFTLREAADLFGRIPPGTPAGESPAERARALVSQLAGTRAGRHASSADDVHDPIGRPVEEHQEVGEVIVEALLPLLTRIAALATREPDSVSAA